MIPKGLDTKNRPLGVSKKIKFFHSFHSRKRPFAVRRAPEGTTMRTLCPGRQKYSASGKNKLDAWNGQRSQ